MATLTLRNVVNRPLTNSEIDGNFTNLNSDIQTRLLASEYTAADVLAKLNTVATDNSGLNANTLQGKFASDFVLNSEISTTVLAPNGDGSQLTGITDIAGGDIIGNAGYILTTDGLGNLSWVANYDANSILTSIKTVDGAASGLDADLLDGLDSTDFVKVTDIGTTVLSPTGDATSLNYGSSFLVPDPTGFNGYVLTTDGATVFWAEEGIVPDSPTLSGASTANEGDTIQVTIGNYNSSYTYSVTLTGGSYERVGSIVYWTLPIVTSDTNHTLNVRAFSGDQPSPNDAQLLVNVLNVPIFDDDAIVEVDFDQYGDEVLVDAVIVDSAYPQGLTTTATYTSTTYEQEGADADWTDYKLDLEVKRPAIKTLSTTTSTSVEISSLDNDGRILSTNDIIAMYDSTALVTKTLAIDTSTNTSTSVIQEDLSGSALVTTQYTIVGPTTSSSYKGEGLAFSSDGTVLYQGYLSWNQANAVSWYVRSSILTTPWDVTTATSSTFFILDSASSTSTGVDTVGSLFATDKYLFVMSKKGTTTSYNVLSRIVLSASKTLTGAIADQTMDLPYYTGNTTNEPHSQGLHISDGGHTVYVGVDNNIYKHTLSRPYDLSSAAAAYDTLANPVPNSQFYIDNGGTNFYSAVDSGSTITFGHGTLSTPYDFTTYTSVSSKSASVNTGTRSDLFIGDYGNYAFINEWIYGGISSVLTKRWTITGAYHTTQTVDVTSLGLPSAPATITDMSDAPLPSVVAGRPDVLYPNFISSTTTELQTYTLDNDIEIGDALRIYSSANPAGVTVAIQGVSTTPYAGGLSSASASGSNLSPTVSASDTPLRFFSYDGKYVFTIETPGRVNRYATGTPPGSDSVINQYALAVPFDATSAFSFVGSKTFSQSSNNGFDFDFSVTGVDAYDFSLINAAMSQDGSQVVITALGSAWDLVTGDQEVKKGMFVLPLTTNYDISSATSAETVINTFRITLAGSGTTDVFITDGGYDHALQFSHDGAYIYQGNGTRYVNAAGGASTTVSTFTNGLAFNSDGTKAYISPNGTSIVEYACTQPGDLTTAVATGEVLNVGPDVQAFAVSDTKIVTWQVSTIQTDENIYSYTYYPSGFTATITHSAAAAGHDPAYGTATLIGEAPFALTPNKYRVVDPGGSNGIGIEYFFVTPASSFRELQFKIDFNREYDIVTKTTIELNKG